jgi:hypothetical protein
MATKKSVSRSVNWIKMGFFAGILATFFFAGADLFNAGLGSGNWLLRFSEKWAIFLFVSYISIIGLVWTSLIFIYFPDRASGLLATAMRFRKRLGSLLWLIVGFVSIFPSWFVFYSPWGEVFAGVFVRLILFAISLAILSFLLTSKKEEHITWQSLLIAGILIGASAVLAEALLSVSNYPFALHWSEGNRLWDYSVVFGRDRYNYSGPEPIFAWIDPGRQTLWGLPFLISNVPIWVVRLWGAILVTVPYTLFGLIALRPNKEAKEYWVLAGIWTLIFLNQGPIYTPLVLAAILVAVARKRPLWLALPLIYLAGDYAGASRFTWRFAPGIWAVMLTLGDAAIVKGKILWRDWVSAGALGLAGIWSKGLPIILGIIAGLLPAAPNGLAPPTNQLGESVETLQGLQQSVTNQPFLMDRLFPNPIYPPGILLGILIATGPIILLLTYLIRRGMWKTIFPQRLVIVIGLAAFLVVGVIASAKVGGGADLHNLDMFFIGLALVAAIAWDSSFMTRITSLIKQIPLVPWILSGLVLIPAFIPFIDGRPLNLPTSERTEFVLNRIQNEVNCARKYGEILFMDQRQLITFGFMGDLPLVVDYEKKYVMDQALSGNGAYFEKFREDLASGRFSLIVSEREAILYKEPDIESIGDSLNEENNAWVHWVTTPLLQSYESVGDFKDAAIELFVPIDRDYDCP